MIASRSRNAILAALVALSVGMLVVPADRASAGSAQRVDQFQVAPGITRDVYRYATSSGVSDVQVVRFSLTDGTVSVRPELGFGVIPRRETTRSTVNRLGPQAVAGVNASFSNPACPPTDPPGEPCGLLVQDGLLLSENVQNNSASWPGAFALFDPGSTSEPWDVGRPSYEGFLEFSSGARVAIDAVNRQPTFGADGGGEAVFFTRAYGSSTGTPAGTHEFVFEDLTLRALTGHFTTMPPLRTTAGDSPIPAGGAVLAALGNPANALKARTGEGVYVRAYTAGLDWAGAQQAVAAGPLILEDGAITSARSWENEGFSAAHHNDNRHPRTIVGFSADGQMMLVTVDGRSSRSVGMTTRQAAELMVDLGARDAVMMDGGGSTTMVHDGVTVNAPSDGGDRPVSTSLVVRTTAEAPDVSRLAGGDRYATAAAIARDGWPGGAPRVLLSTGEGFADALAGAPLAHDLGAPLLLTGRSVLPRSTLDAFASLGTQEVVILGGTAAVTDDVERTLRNRGLTVTRVAGADRTDTAARIARRVGSASGRAFLVSGDGFPDALSAGVPAIRADAPLLLTSNGQLTQPTWDALAELRIREVLIAGGPAVVPQAVEQQLGARGYRVTRLWGDDRYETSTELVDWAASHTGLSTRTPAMATGADYPDALAGGPYAARRGLPVVLSDRWDVDRSSATGGWLRARALDGAVLFGGRAVLASWIAFEVQQLADAS